MNKLITCSLVFTLVALTCAYDFQDDEYNQILARDFEELETESVNVHPRARRDEEAASGATDKCRKRRSKYCCAEETLERIHEEHKTLKRECYKEVTGKEKPSGYHGHSDPFKCDKEKVEKHKKEMICVMQCVGQKDESLDAEGNIKEDVLRSKLKEKFAKEEWVVAKLDAMVDKCLAEAKQVPEGKQGSAKGEDEKESCNGVGMRFGHCFWKELQFGCPAENIKDMKSCEKVREKIRNHQDFPFPRHSDEE